jgi:selenocysteine lyase/cysteine desulfurase
MVGSMATLLLGEDPRATLSPLHPFIEPLYARLFDEARIQVVVMALPALPSRALRLSAHLYNHEAQFERLAAVLAASRA